jgi:hypothetical protein
VLVWFPNSHLVNPPLIFDHIDRVASIFLKRSKFLIFHNKSDVFKVLHRDYLDRRYLPKEFDGDREPIDNTVFVRKVLDLEQYFVQLMSSKIKK